MTTVCKLQRTKTGGAEGRGETNVYRRKEKEIKEERIKTER